MEQIGAVDSQLPDELLERAVGKSSAESLAELRSLSDFTDDVRPAEKLHDFCGAPQGRVFFWF